MGLKYCKVSLLFCIGCIGLVFLSVHALASDFEFPSFPRDRRIPNGLAIIKLESGRYGIGFVVGSKLFTAAHMLLNEKVTSVQVTQDNHYADITGSLSPLPILMPGYGVENEITAGVDDSPQGGEQYREEIIGRTQPAFDAGYIDLLLPVKTDFIFAGQADPYELVAYVRTLPQRYKESIFRIDPLGAIEIHETKLGSFTYSVYSTENGISIGFKPPNVNILGEYDIKSREGDSGSPLFFEIPDGRFLVIGILTGRIGILPDPWGGLNRQNATVFNAWQPVAKWLRESHPELFLEELTKCAGALTPPAQTL
jgi:hypothetical protein